MFTRLTAAGVEWRDGTSELVDTIILATGYRPNLHCLEGLGALDVHGAPLHRRGVSTRIPGLGFVGLPGQRNMASATLRGATPDAKHVIRALWRAPLIEHDSGAIEC
jgi:putative flavoprotein involved in K+ transport